MARRRPPFVRDVKQQHPGKRIEVWQQDEARVGQQGTLTQVWMRSFFWSYSSPLRRSRTVPSTRVSVQVWQIPIRQP